jgi:hypothetical protein
MRDALDENVVCGREHNRDNPDQLYDLNYACL